MLNLIIDSCRFLDNEISFEQLKDNLKKDRLTITKKNNEINFSYLNKPFNISIIKNLLIDGSLDNYLLTILNNKNQLINDIGIGAIYKGYKLILKKLQDDNKSKLYLLDYMTKPKVLTKYFDFFESLINTLDINDRYLFRQLNETELFSSNTSKNYYKDFYNEKDKLLLSSIDYETKFEFYFSLENLSYQKLFLTVKQNLNIFYDFLIFLQETKNIDENNYCDFFNFDNFSYFQNKNYILLKEKTNIKMFNIKETSFLFEDFNQKDVLNLFTTNDLMILNSDNKEDINEISKSLINIIYSILPNISYEINTEMFIIKKFENFLIIKEKEFLNLNIDINKENSLNKFNNKI